MGLLRNLLTKHPRAQLYALADAATLPGLLEPLYAIGRQHYACLLPGHVEPEVAHVAPYLIALTADLPLINWLEPQLELPWGYVIESELPLRPLHLHLRRFSQTRGPHGEEWLFRFWDPRVLRTMAAILTPMQAAAFMQKIARIYLFGHGARIPVNVEWDVALARIRFVDAPGIGEQGAVHHAGV